jgi:polysaccharide export outer membrane protein
VGRLRLLAIAAVFGGLAASAESVLRAGDADQGIATPYEIGPGDVIQVTVLGQASFSGEFTVGADGIMPYPFLGKVKAAEMSPAELERKLTTLLSEGYLKRPQIAVTVKQYRSQKVYVTGEVKTPGPYGLRPERTLLSLLQDVGELNPTAGHELIVVRQPPMPPAPEPWPSPSPVAEGGGTEPAPEASPSPSPSPLPMPRPGPALPGEVPGSTVFRINLRELRAGYPDRDIHLQVGDTVYVPKASQVYVTGHVARPGSFRYEEGQTVFQVLALAGGVTERGSEKGVRLIRMVDGKRRELKPRPTDVVQAEDTIHVPERFF